MEIPELEICFCCFICLFLFPLISSKSSSVSEKNRICWPYPSGFMPLFHNRGRHGGGGGFSTYGSSCGCLHLRSALQRISLVSQPPPNIPEDCEKYRRQLWELVWIPLFSVAPSHWAPIVLSLSVFNDLMQQFLQASMVASYSSHTLAHVKSGLTSLALYRYLSFMRSRFSWVPCNTSFMMISI